VADEKFVTGNIRGKARIASKGAVGTSLGKHSARRVGKNGTDAACDYSRGWLGVLLSLE
jgi:hypothetical protein